MGSFKKAKQRLVFLVVLCVFWLSGIGFTPAWSEGAVPPVPSSAPFLESASAPTPAAKNMIEDIYYRDGQLTLHSDGEGKVLIKNRFVLSDPGRLVLDLENSAIQNRGLLRPIEVRGENIQQIRIGQFDEETVRVVIEAFAPENLRLTYPKGGKALLTVSAESGIDIATLPSDVQLGQVQKVSVKKDGGDTVIRLAASAGIVHQLVKEQGKIFVQLQNIDSLPGKVTFDKAQYPLLEGISLEPLTPGQPNSKLVIDLKSSQTEMVASLSDSGKILDVTLLESSRISSRSNGSAPVPGGSIGGSKAPYRARVVIDAGHGGKDFGANRVGINEKDLNLSVALRLKHALEARGVQVFMTRSSDVFLPLPEITRITNNIRPDLFVSVHTNSSESAAINGLETYYYTPQSLPLANKVHQKLVNAIPSPDRGVRRAMFYVIHHTTVPAILCEMGYISNSAERGQLVSDSRKQETAEAIAEGVVEYLKSRLSANAR